jgi:hypothetical protein
MFELSESMVGIYKIEDKTRTICVYPRLIKEKAIRLREEYEK